MPVWKETKGWRYRFQYRGKKYNRAWFQTKTEAREAEAAHRARVKKATQRPPTKTAMAFSTLANEYLDFSRRRHTTKTYKYKVFVFKSFLAFAGDLPLDRIDLPILEAYLQTRPSNYNYNVHRKELSALFNWAWRRRYLPENPCLWLERLPETRQSKKIPTLEEMAQIIMAAGPDRPFLLVLYHTLARVDEILRLGWEDVNFEEHTIRLWTRKRQDGSWAADTLPMNQILYDTLKGLYETRTGEYVFTNPKTGTRYFHRPKLMRGICRRAGVRHFGFHAIRHFVASLLHDREKVSLAQVSKLLRHTTKATTERYLQVVDQSSREALKKLEGINLPMESSHEKSRPASADL